MIDWRWMSKGGLLLDGTGDIALTGSDGLESLEDMVRTRLKAALDGWKLYRIGADLGEQIGKTVDAELELEIKRQVVRSLTTEFMPRGAFRVETLADGGRVHVMVYVSGSLIAKAVVTKNAAGETGVS